MASGVVASIQLTLVSNAVTTAVTINNPVGVDPTGDGLSISAVANGVISVPAITSLTCNPVNLSANGAAGCIVALNTAAPAGGSSVTLASNNASLTVPASVTVAAGATTATFSATAAASIASNQSATVTATLGSSSQTATISLLAPVLVSDLGLQSHQSRAERGQHLHGDADPDRSRRRIERDAGEQQRFAHRTGIGDGSGGSHHGDLQRDGGGFDREQSERDGNRDPRQQFANGDDQSAGAGAGFGRGLQSHQSRAERGQHLHGDADPDRSRGRIERDAGEQQRFAHRTGIGDGSGGSHHRDVQRDGGGFDREQSERDGDGDPRQQFADGDDQPAGAGAGFGRGLQSHQSGAERGQHLHGDADPDRSRGRIERDAGEQQRFAHRAGIGDGSGGSHHGDVQRDGGGYDREQSERDGDGDPRQQFADGDDQSAGAGAGFGRGLQSHQSRAERGQHLHGDADPDRSRRRIERDAGEQQRFAHRTGIGDGSGGSHHGDLQRDGGGFDREQSERDGNGDPRQQFADGAISLLAPVLVSGVACSPASLGQSAVSTCTVTLTQTAPTGGTSVTLGSNNTLLTVPASVTVAAGATTATFSATAAATIASNQSATVTATLGSSSRTGTVSLVAPVVSGVACVPTSLGQSAISTCTVTLTQTAPAAGTGVTLGSNNALLTVPASVTVSAGATTATFSATAGSSIPSNQSATVTATLGASSQTAIIGLSVPGLVSGVACNPASLGQSAVSTCTVTLTQSAPTGGTGVTLASNNALLTVPASVTVASGATTATFSAIGGGHHRQQSERDRHCDARHQFSDRRRRSCGAARLGRGLHSRQSRPERGQHVYGHATQTAPTGGTGVTLASNNSLLTVPTSVTVTAGTTTATFSATANADIPNNQSATVTATLGASSQTAAISLLAPVLVSIVACSPASLGQSAVSTCTVTLTQNAPTGGTNVTLASNNTSLIVPASVTVSAGATTATFSATAAATIASNQSATVTATLGSSPQTATISLLAPVLVSGVACNPAVLSPGGSSSCNLSLTQAAPAISLVHVTSCGPQTFRRSTCIIPATGSGNLIVVGWQTEGGVDTSVTIGSITDNVGNTYAEAGAARSVDSAAGSVGDLWYAMNSVSGATTLTITPSSVVTDASAVIWEFSGADLAAPLDRTAILNSQLASVSPAGAAVTTTAGADVVISLTTADNVPGLSGSTFVSDSTVQGNGWAHLITSSPGTYAAQWSQSPAGTYASSTVAFKAAGSVTLTSNNPSLTVPASVTVPVGASTAAFSATAAASFASNQSATVTATFGASSQTAVISLMAPGGSGGGGSGGSSGGGGGGGGSNVGGYSFSVSPANLTMSAPTSGGTVTQTVVLSVQSSSQLDTTLTFASSVATSQAQNWLSVSPSSGTLTLAPGSTHSSFTYSATVTITANSTGIGAGSEYQGVVNYLAGGEMATTGVTMNVTAQSAPPSLSVSPLTSNFTLTQGTSPAQGQVTVSNTGGGSLQFRAQATSTPGTWLSLTGSGSGGATPSSPASLAFTADPTGLMPGIYTGQITVQAANLATQVVVSVTLAVSQATQSLSLSQSGLTFSAVAGGQTPPSQSFTVSSQGSGSLSWTAEAQTISNPLAPSANWLSIRSVGRVSNGGQTGAPVEVSVNTAGLPAGQYYGSVDIDAPNATNNPQSVVVLFNVAAASGTTNNVGFSTGGVILSGAAGSTTPPQQQISLFNPSNNTINYSATISTANGVGWLSISPASGQLLPGTTSISIAANLAELSSGVQTGTVDFAFDNGTTGVLQVAVIATSGTSGSDVTGSAVSAHALTTSSACAGGNPGYLVPVFRQPVSQSVLQAAVPQTVQLEVVDGCGSPLAANNGGAVQVSFGNEDASINLQDVGGGIWEGTWTPVNAAALFTIQAVASELSPGLSSSAAGPPVTVQAASANAPAVISAVVNAASSAQAMPQIVTPGSYVAIYGTSLASNGEPVADAIPLPGTLNDTQLFLGGQPMPLIYAGPGQVNALIPQNLNPNTSYQLVIQRGSTLSVPAPLTTAGYQPGIYTLDLSGTGQGIVEIAGTTLLAAPAGSGSRPVQSGSEYLVIFATGLGPVMGANGATPPADGAAAPLATIYQTTAAITATIGGVDVPVLFSGLTPSLVALYQVNIQVPAGIPTGDAVPLVLTVTDPVTGQSVQSNTVTLAVQ